MGVKLADAALQEGIDRFPGFEDQQKLGVAAYLALPAKMEIKPGTILAQAASRSITRASAMRSAVV